MNAPVRACRLVLDLQGDSRSDIVNALENIAMHIDRQELTKGCSGGVNSGYSYEYTESDHPTTEEYHSQLRVFLGKETNK